MKDFTDDALAISVGKLLQRGTLQTLNATAGIKSLVAKLGVTV